MVYRIIVQEPAAEDAREYAAYILKKSKSPAAANRWLDKLEAVIRSLSEMPSPFKAIEEQDEFDIRLQQVVHFSHRVIYHVNEETQTVHVLRIYHGAKQPLSPDDIVNWEI